PRLPAGRPRSVVEERPAAQRGSLAPRSSASAVDPAQCLLGGFSPAAPISDAWTFHPDAWDFTVRSAMSKHLYGRPSRSVRFGPARRRRRRIMMKQPLNDDALNQLFREARTYNAWQDRPVSDETLRQLYDLMKWAPTSANMSPARILFLRTREA